MSPRRRPFPKRYCPHCGVFGSTLANFTMRWHRLPADVSEISLVWCPGSKQDGLDAPPAQPVDDTPALSMKGLL